MSESKSKFQKLTPIRDAEIGIYRDALDFAFENDDLRNIAVSGAYSAGKSSVLESYKAKHTDKKFLHISLAHFEEAKDSFESKIAEKGEGKPDKTNAPVIVKESVLEGKILNQLIHQIAPGRIPQTNFRIKQTVSQKKLFLWAIEITAFIVSLLHILNFKTWQTHVGNISTTWLKNIFSLTIKNTSFVLSGIACVALIAVFLYQIIKIQVNKGVFKKISADKFAIEIFEGSNDSYFDKYLNEVLYLFEQCEADVIVFEDMDRYNANRIFERLREVNNLINAQRSKNKAAKPLRFLYLLRDDIFVSKDRTKFFDFIIPIVPVVDGSNSYDQFIKHLTDGGVFELFDEPFLQGLSLYIDDMRILKNICNEFVIYNSRLNIIELDHNKLMAMVAYKNLFPRDFSDLQLGKGFVFTLFDKKEQFIAEKIAQLEVEKEAVKAKSEAVKREHLKSIQELEVIYTDRKNKLNYYQHDERGKLETEHIVRKKAIEDRNNSQLPIFEENIVGIENKITKTKSDLLHDIITRENIDEIFAVESKNEIGDISDFKDIRGNAYFALLKYLIRNGYIDESYADYMTYFYEHSLSRTDKIFLRSIADQIKKEPDYQLKEPHKIVNRLDVSVFEQPEVLNYDLLFYLLRACAVDMTSPPIALPKVPTFLSIKSRREKEPKLLIAMVEQILSQADYRFLQGAFIKIQDEKLNDLVNFLNSIRKDCLERIITERTVFSVANCDEFVFRTLIVTPDKDLMENTNFRKVLVTYVSTQADFLSSDRFKEEPLKSMFGDSAQSELIRTTLLTRIETLGIYFQSINYETVDAILFEQVYKRSLYEINYQNIALMLKSQYELNESDNFKHKNYTLIKIQSDSPLAVYIEENIDDYLDIFIGFCGEEICDNEAEVITILNNDAVSDNHKSAYIDALTTVIQSVVAVKNNELWKQLLTSDLLAHTENNILDYYCAQKSVLTDELVAFMNKQNKEYNYTDVRSQYEDTVQLKFFNSVLRCDKLENRHYRSVLQTLGRVYTKGFNVEDVTDDKILILIDIGVISMHKDSLVFLREYYPDAVIPYIQKSISVYVNDVLDEDSFDLSEALEVLLLSVDDKHKLDLLKKITDTLTARKQQYSDAIRAHILLNNLDEADIPHFINSYPGEGALTKCAIEKIAFNEIQAIFDNEYGINKGLVDKLLASNISRDAKLKLFALLLPELDELQCKNYLHQLDLQDYIGLFEQKRPKIEISGINTRLLEVFQRKNWITKFEEDEKEDGYYRAFGRKAHKGKDKDEVILL